MEQRQIKSGDKNYFIRILGQTEKWKDKSFSRIRIAPSMTTIINKNKC